MPVDLAVRVFVLVRAYAYAPIRVWPVKDLQAIGYKAMKSADTKQLG